MNDANGYNLEIGDPVKVDGKETGIVDSFGGLGIFVKLDPDKAILDFAVDQVERRHRNKWWDVLDWVCTNCRKTYKANRYERLRTTCCPECETL